MICCLIIVNCLLRGMKGLEAHITRRGDAQATCKKGRGVPYALKEQVENKWDRWQGWRSDESTCLPPMWPRFDFPTRLQMWIEFVGSLLCFQRFSPGYSGFHPLTKNQHLICRKQ